MPRTRSILSGYILVSLSSDLNSDCLELRLSFLIWTASCISHQDPRKCLLITRIHENVFRTELVSKNPSLRKRVCHLISSKGSTYHITYSDLFGTMVSINYSNMIKITKNQFRKNHHLDFWAHLKSLLFLEMWRSCSPSTGLWWITL
jgi:hypothetical protein